MARRIFRRFESRDHRNRYYSLQNPLKNSYPQNTHVVICRNLSGPAPKMPAHFPLRRKRASAAIRRPPVRAKRCLQTARLFRKRGWTGGVNVWSAKPLTPYTDNVMGPHNNRLWSGVFPIGKFEDAQAPLLTKVGHRGVIVGIDLGRFLESVPFGNLKGLFFYCSATQRWWVSLWTIVRDTMGPNTYIFISTIKLMGAYALLTFIQSGYKTEHLQLPPIPLMETNMRQRAFSTIY